MPEVRALREHSGTPVLSCQYSERAIESLHACQINRETTACTGYDPRSSCEAPALLCANQWHGKAIAAKLARPMWHSQRQQLPKSALRCNGRAFGRLECGLSPHRCLCRHFCSTRTKDSPDHRLGRFVSAKGRASFEI